MIKLFIAILLFYILIGIFLFFKQESFLYFPTQNTNTIIYTEKIFTNEDESIHVTILNEGEDKAIIYFGGNAENVNNNASKFSYIFHDYTVYLVSYRGYNNSTGTPSEKNLYSDALYVFDSIKKQYENIFVIGRSLGSGVATFLASKRDINKLVLITPFDSIINVAQEKIPFYPISIILKDKYDSLSRVDFIKAKTLILSAQNDRVIDSHHTQNLINKFPKSQLTSKTIENENHNSISNNKEYYDSLKEFLYD